MWSHNAFLGGGLQVAPCTARHFFLFCQEKVTKRRPPLHPGLVALRPDFPHSGAAPEARHEGTPLSLRFPLGVHASRPPTQRLRSAS
ncbi:hypothetical protein F3I76_05580 [Pseudomonas sp. MT4]|nr:hypothetical protein [Pseudomonas sp. MT4]